MQPGLLRSGAVEQRLDQRRVVGGDPAAGAIEDDPQGTGGPLEDHGVDDTGQGGGGAAVTGAGCGSGEAFRGARARCGRGGGDAALAGGGSGEAYRVHRAGYGSGGRLVGAAGREPVAFQPQGRRPVRGQPGRRPRGIGRQLGVPPGAVGFDTDVDATLGIHQPGWAAGQHGGTAHECLDTGPGLGQSVEVGDDPDRRTGIRVECGQAPGQLFHRPMVRHAGAVRTARARRGGGGRPQAASRWRPPLPSRAPPRSPRA